MPMGRIRTRYFRDVLAPTILTSRASAVLAEEEAAMGNERTARERALRAARVVTMGLVLGATPGCYAAHSTSVVTPGDDAAAPEADASVVAPVDDAALADAGPACGPGDDWAACCEAIGWDWERGCGAWGPFVPPESEVA